MKPYKKYKPSGIEWVGKIPEHWEVDRAKWTVTDCRNGIWGEEPDDINDLPCVRVADFDRTAFRVRIDDPTMRAVAPNERRGRLLQSGDLLLEKSGGGDLQPVGAVMQYDHDVEAVCANFIARMPVAPGYASRFLTYLHGHLNAGGVNTRSIKQTTGIQNIDSQQYLNEAVAHPPLDEQRAIASFLDRETGRIDGLIEKKERFIELLKEKRKALITHAVTKGLDPNAPMKDSGIEWLGKIPEHWEVDRAKWTVTDCRNGIWGEEPDDINDLPCVRVADFDRTAFRVRIDDPTMRAVAPNERRGRLLQSGDLLLEKSGGGDLQPVGAVMQYDHDVEAVCANFIARMPVAPGYASRFLTYLHGHLNAGGVNTRSIKQTTGIQNIDSQQYLNEAVAHPPLDEQRAIASFLDRETGRIDELVSKTKESIEKLREYRTALITAAVTGKIDIGGNGS